MYLAYLDPGSGGMLVAAIVAGISGLAVVVRMWWRKVTAKLRRRTPAEPESTATPAAAPGEQAPASPRPARDS